MKNMRRCQACVDKMAGIACLGEMAGVDPHIFQRRPPARHAEHSRANALARIADSQPPLRRDAEAGVSGSEQFERPLRDNLRQRQRLAGCRGRRPSQAPEPRGMAPADKSAWPADQTAVLIADAGVGAQELPLPAESGHRDGRVIGDDRRGVLRRINLFLIENARSRRNQARSGSL